MSHRSGAYRDARSHPGHHDGAHATQRAPRPSHPAPQRRGDAKGYTLAHAGRQVRFGPVMFWIVVGTVVIMGAWSITTATYFAFRDDVLTRLLARQAEMQFAYEDRIAELRALVDRTTSRQLLDQEQFEQKLDQIQRKQAMLESRANALAALPDIGITTGSIRPAARPQAAAETPPKPSPISDTVIFVAPPDREARLESRSVAVAENTDPAAHSDGVGSVLTRLHASLSRVEQRQVRALDTIEDTFETKARRMRGVFADLGLDAGRMEPPAARGNVGGPFVPVRPPANASEFERQLYRINLSRAQIERLRRTLALVPYRKPVLGELETSSGFGVRTDPFLGRPAMHTGLDFRGDSGDPVRATAGGTIVTAGWSGGYGRLVEIDHGNGLSTRYGHLSEINVKVGERVQIGQVIGAIGSTGRSTGPHLHYETRVNGDPVDPQKFLRAGLRLGSV